MIPFCFWRRLGEFIVEGKREVDKLVLEIKGMSVVLVVF